MRKVHVKLIVDLEIHAEEGVEIGEVIDEMDYNFASQTTGADIADSEIKDYEVADSR